MTAQHATCPVHDEAMNARDRFCVDQRERQKDINEALFQKCAENQTAISSLNAKMNWVFGATAGAAFAGGLVGQIALWLFSHGGIKP